MADNKTAVVILGAGLGTRMKSAKPKVLHPIAGRPMIQHLMASLEPLQPDSMRVIVGPEMDAVAAAVRPHPTVIQHERRGTAHAVATTREALQGFAGDVLIVYGDTPLLTTATLAKMIERRRQEPRPAIVVLGFRPADPAAYGRLIVDAEGRLDAIVEAKDASAAELAIGLCNAGTMAVDDSVLFTLLAEVGNANAKGEYYLTDIVGLARSRGLACAVVEGSESELVGINSRADLARAEAFVQDALRARAMAEGVTLLDPATVYLSHDTRFGRDVTVAPCVVFGPGVSVGNDVEIRAFCHLEGASIADGAQIGPFARLRPGADVAAGAHIGNFVEIKKARIEAGAKVNHLTYIGDARIGAKANVGAGTITCNYDGFDKAFTDVGEGAFIGSNSSLVAPVRIGRGAIIGAGSVVARDVDDDALALTRGAHSEKKGWAKSFRDKKREIKERNSAKKD